MCHTAKGPGGGIYNASSAILNITNSTVSGNTAADGSGIANQGTATVNSSTVSNNTASYTGGGIYNLNLLTTPIAPLAVTERILQLVASTT